MQSQNGRAELDVSAWKLPKAKPDRKMKIISL